MCLTVLKSPENPYHDEIESSVWFIVKRWDQLSVCRETSNCFTSNFLRIKPFSQHAWESQSIDASGKLWAPLSPTCLFKKHIVTTAEKWWAELAGLEAAKKKKKKRKTYYIWFVAASEYSHIVYCVGSLTGVAHQKKKKKKSGNISIVMILRDLLYSPVWLCLNFSRAVGSPLVMDPNSICRKAKRLAGKQAELCQTQPEIVNEVAKGARLGVRECQYQFRYRRWNCTSHNKYFGKILQQGE